MRVGSACVYYDEERDPPPSVPSVPVPEGLFEAGHLYKKVSLIL